MLINSFSINFVICYKEKLTQKWLEIHELNKSFIHIELNLKNPSYLLSAGQSYGSVR